MSEQVQTQEEQATLPKVQLGFGRALTVMYGENWRETVSETEINKARHFYHCGLNDLQILIQVSNAQLSQNVHNVFGTLTVGAEKQLAEQAALSTAQTQALSTDQVPALTAADLSVLDVSAVKRPAKKAAVKPAAKVAAKAAKRSKK